jgi:hypothetical protein
MAQHQVVGNYGWNPGNGSSPLRRVHVLRGFDAVNAMRLTRNAVPADTYGSGEANEIYSGMVISLNDDGKWVRGQFAADRTCYIALSNASDTDVRASGLLPALSCLDDYEIETPWYDTAGSYAADATYLKAATAGDAGKVTDASGPADAVIAKVTRAPYKLNQVDTLTGNDGVATHPFQSNELGTTEVISFVTKQD